MGRQSSRLWFGCDHKDIYFNGHYHKAMYLTDEKSNPTLVWEKLLDNMALALSFIGSIGFYIAGQFTVYWGDGTQNSYNYDSLTFIAHSAPNDENTQIKIYGTITDIAFDTSVLASSNLYSIDTPFPYMEGKESFDECFGFCNKLEILSDKLFVNNPQAKSFINCFYNCTALKDLPPNLFSECNQTNGDAFVNAFLGCTALENIPPTLFIENISIEKLERTFANCTSLKEFPAALLASCVNLTSMKECFLSSGLTQIVGGFSTCEKLSDLEGCFKNCTSLTYVSENLFDNNLEISNVIECFSNDSNIESAVPPLWERGAITALNAQKCYYNCTKALNYGDIPSNWKY